MVLVVFVPADYLREGCKPRRGGGVDCLRKRDNSDQETKPEEQ